MIDFPIFYKSFKKRVLHPKFDIHGFIEILELLQQCDYFLFFLNLFISYALSAYSYWFAEIESRPW